MADRHPDPAISTYTRLLSLAVHELRTPTSVVSGYLRMLQLDQDPPRSPRQQKMVSESEKACARIAALIAELSEVGKLDGGTATAASERFDLFDVLQGVAAGVHEAEDRQVTLDLRGATSGAPMQGDLPRLRSAFTALFRAVMREQTNTCTVVGERSVNVPVGNGAAGTATVVIVEEGRLAQVKAATPEPFDEYRGGLGLLLPIARRVVEQHGGRIGSAGAHGPTTAIIVSLPLRAN